MQSRLQRALTCEIASSRLQQHGGVCDIFTICDERVRADSTKANKGIFLSLTVSTASHVGVRGNASLQVVSTRAYIFSTDQRRTESDFFTCEEQKHTQSAAQNKNNAWSQICCQPEIGLNSKKHAKIG
jgi:hypothetical protein